MSNAHSGCDGIGCALTWAVILTLVAVMLTDRLRTCLLVGDGCQVGLSATEAQASGYVEACAPIASAPRLGQRRT